MYLKKAETVDGEVKALSSGQRSCLCLLCFSALSFVFFIKFLLLFFYLATLKSQRQVPFIQILCLQFANLKLWHSKAQPHARETKLE